LQEPYFRVRLSNILGDEASARSGPQRGCGALKAGAKRGGLRGRTHTGEAGVKPDTGKKGVANISGKSVRYSACRNSR